MDTKFEYKRTLVAQSPMLHFQHREKGATLRATEVKPKLDRFIIKKMGKENVPQKWFLSESNALNYKMRFEVLPGGTIEDAPPIYFGNSGKKPFDPEYIRCVRAKCVVKILCFIPELMEKIKEVFEEFFICTNFGRMQNKGFGSFAVEESNKSPAEIGKMLCAASGAQACYAFSGKNDPFGVIKTVYSVMKAGFNRSRWPNPKEWEYHRSYLYEYFHEERNGNLTNEKAAMKQQKVSPVVNHPDHKKDPPELNQEPYYYVRALLGIGDHLEYIVGHELRPDKNGVNRFQPIAEELPNGKFRVKKETVSISSDEVKRFASPIFFKIIDGKVYMVANRIDKRIFGQAFDFVNKSKSLEGVRVPDKFDIDDFMNWFVEKYNRETSNFKAGPSSYGIGEPIQTVYQVKGENKNG